MPGKRKDFSYQSTTSQPRKQRFTANDIQWACDHKESLTIRAEKFGFSDKQQAVVRYHNIIKSPLLATDKARLDQELNMYKQIEDFKRFWLGRTRNKANLDAHDARDTFSQNVVDQKACLLKMQPRIASVASDTSNLSLTDDATTSKALFQTRNANTTRQNHHCRYYTNG